MSPITAEQSGAFIERFSLPPTGDGPLAGLRFAVKDLIDVAGHRTGCGNPDWLSTHPPARVSAVCVEQLLAAGAACEGKTITDEVAFSLLGENFFYGTPLNPAAPDRVPGGSSCGSASAVACGLVDFALGTDTGGSVRIPASYCGLWGDATFTRHRLGGRRDAVFADFRHSRRAGPPQRRARTGDGRAARRRTNWFA